MSKERISNPNFPDNIYFKFYFIIDPHFRIPELNYSKN